MAQMPCPCKRQNGRLTTLKLLRVRRVRKRDNPAMVVVALLLAVAGRLAAQTGRPDAPVGNQPTNVGPKIAGDSSGYLYDVDPDFRHRMLVARRDAVKQRMMNDAAKLLAMSKQLDEELQGHEPTQADLKRLDEIAKLARSVRDQMRQ